MVSTLLARAHESDTVLRPVSFLFHHQIDAVRALAETAATLSRPVTETLGPAGVAALITIAVVPIVLVLVATLTGAARAMAA
jgi:hypothetical protein